MWPEVGETVLVRVGGTDAAPKLRPAMIVRVDVEEQDRIDVQIFRLNGDGSVLRKDVEKGMAEDQWRFRGNPITVGGE